MANTTPLRRSGGISTPGSRSRIWKWPADPAEIQDWVYTDRRVYDLELERIFLGPTWNYVALEAELPRPGDYIRRISAASRSSWPATRPPGACLRKPLRASRGRVLQDVPRHAAQFICPYHQWTYDLFGRAAVWCRFAAA